MANTGFTHLTDDGGGGAVRVVDTIVLRVGVMAVAILLIRVKHVRVLVVIVRLLLARTDGVSRLLLVKTASSTTAIRGGAG
jgi:hypothetical protein